MNRLHHAGACLVIKGDHLRLNQKMGYQIAHALTDRVFMPGNEADFKVLSPVVVTDTVLMVDNFTGEQASPKHLFHDYAMLGYIFVTRFCEGVIRAIQHYVPRPVPPAATFPSGVFGSLGDKDAILGMMALDKGLGVPDKPTPTGHRFVGNHCRLATATLTKSRWNQVRRWIIAGPEVGLATVRAFSLLSMPWQVRQRIPAPASGGGIGVAGQLSCWLSATAFADTCRLLAMGREVDAFRGHNGISLICACS